MLFCVIKETCVLSYYELALLFKIRKLKKYVFCLIQTSPNCYHSMVDGFVIYIKSNAIWVFQLLLGLSMEIRLKVKTRPKAT